MKIADIFKTKAAVSFPKPSTIITLDPTIKYFAYLWLQLKESLAVDNFSCTYLRYLFVIRYNCLCLLVCLHEFIKRAAFCGNIRNCENVGIILRIVGDLKRISRKNNCRI